MGVVGELRPEEDVQPAGRVIGEAAAAAAGRLRLGAPARPGVNVRVVEEGPVRAPFPGEDDGDLVVAVPGGAAQRRRVWGWRRPQVAPGVRAEVVAPDAGVVEVVLAEPVPAVTAAESGKAQEAPRDRVEDVLLGAADAGRRAVRLLQLPAHRDGVERPRLGVLLAAAALVVAAPADDAP